MQLLVNIYMKGQGRVDKSDATPAFRMHLGSYRRKANQICIFSADFCKYLGKRFEARLRRLPGIRCVSEIVDFPSLSFSLLNPKMKASQRRSLLILMFYDFDLVSDLKYL